jgi:hypothetical protein
MPEVSILTPAFRPQYLDLTIASALAQTYTDFELLISDDSSDESVASVVSKWQDPRIRYCKNPRRQMPGANRDHLLGLASGRYVKFLFDDDFLFPQSVETLVEIAELTQSQLVFHGRHYVDEAGRVLSSPLPVPLGQYETLTRPVFFDRLVGSINNFIGEPSNILFERSAYQRLKAPFAVGGFPMRFLTDVSLYLNFIVQGYRVTGVGMMGSAFRQHAQQTSNESYPGFSAGLFEWELFMRWAMEEGDLQPERYEAGLAHLHGLYRPHLADFPELGPLLELAGEPGAGGYWSREFRDCATRAYKAIEARVLARKQARGPS